MSLYVCSTPHHVLVALCTMYLKREKGYIYISNNVDELSDYLKWLTGNLDKLELVDRAQYRRRKNFLDAIYVETLKDFFEKPQLKELITKYNSTVIFPWNVFSIQKKAVSIYNMSKNVTLIEDGSMVYKKKADNPIKKIIKKSLFGIKYNFVNDAKISEIKVSFPNEYPEAFRNKISKLDMDVLMENIDHEDIVTIISAFIDTETVRKLEDISTTTSKSKILILTQPFYLFNGVPQERQIEMYRDIYETYKDKYDIFIKKHPSDKLDYNFEGVIEINGKFPSELLNYMDIEFEKAIGICTSAVDQIRANERINTDPHFFEKVNV